MRRIRDYRIPEDEMREVLMDSNLPERYWVANTDCIAPQDIRKWVQEALANIKTWLGMGHGFYIHGRFNVGKSSLAAILLMDAARRCERCLWLPTRHIPGVIFRDTERNAKLHDRLLSSDLLIIDDLGSEKFRLSGPAGAALEAAARDMYDRHRSVIITSNTNWDQLPSAYTRADGLVSVLRRVIVPVGIDNDQWPDNLESAW